MKFRCERDVLAEALGTAGRAVPNRGNLPVLSGVRLELSGDRLRLAGSDLDLTIQIEISVGGAVDGTAVIPAKLAGDIVKSLDEGAVDVVVDDDEARISAGRSQFSIRVLPADEFPQLPGAGDGETVLPAEVVAHGLKQVVRAASHDDSRPILTGVLLAGEDGGLRMVATDSYRLALRDLREASVLGADQRRLVPSKALTELSRLIGGADEVGLRFGERDASFRVGDALLTTRLLEGEFPNFAQLIPASYPNRLTVGRTALLDAIRRVKLLIQEATTPVRLNMRADGLELSVITADVGEAHEEIDAKYEGTDLTVAFNPDYLADGVDAIDGDEVVIETVDGLKAATIRSDDQPDFMYLLMPVRVA